jgi:cobalamin biosynthesis protein CobT
MDLESIIRELEASLAEEESTEDEDDDQMAMESLADGEEAGTDKGEDPKVVVSEEDEDDTAKDDDTIDLEEILREMEADMTDADDDEMEKKVEENKKLKSELNQAYKAIKSLQGTINEVNLLNAKLLFANKLFRAHNMTNEQKVKVIETLDRTKSVREVKLVYSTLAENFKYTSVSKVAKKTITEGIASRAVKSTKPTAAQQKQVISENADFANRFKKLAGIIK